jgi:hypothetical protein
VIASRSLDVGGRNLEGVGLIFGNPAEAGLAWTQYAIIDEWRCFGAGRRRKEKGLDGKFGM